MAFIISEDLTSTKQTSGLKIIVRRVNKSSISNQTG